MEAKTDLLIEQTEASSVKTSTPMLSETNTISRSGRSVEKSQKYSLDAEWRYANKWRKRWIIFDNMHKSHGALNSNEKGDLQHEGKTIDKVFHKAAFDETIVKFLKWQKNWPF